MQTHTQHYIAGAWVKAQSTESFKVYDSNTEEVMATVPAGTVEEASRAVLAARSAFEAWSSLPVETRASYLEKISAGIKARTDELTTVIAREVGMPLKLSRSVQVGAPVFNWANFAKVIRGFEWEEKVGNSLVVREPIGVVSCITPWNFPLNQISLKVAAALAAGCTVVLKPSEIAPLNAIILAEIIHEVGLPAGVFNLVHGAGPVVGELLSSHSEVDMVSFTGSTRAGKRVGELASQSVKKVALELGGKSASVILEDADFEAAVKGTLSACLLNSGQTCSAHTRMLIPENRLEEVKGLIRTAIAKYPIGSSLDEKTRLGPLVSASQRDRVLSFIETGLREGAELICGSAARPAFVKGYFVEPTVLRVQPGDTLAKEEIFGPVLVVLTYKDVDQAIAIANDSIYGLGGGVWGADEKNALSVAKRIRTGQVELNGGVFNANVPFGGYKQSGIGREYGKYGLEEFLQYKAIQTKAA